MYLLCSSKEARIPGTEPARRRETGKEMDQRRDQKPQLTVRPLPVAQAEFLTRRLTQSAAVC